MSEDRPSPHEIVLVRRRGGGHEDGHHGGAWKIAFADFMTALMCFFLVMWLINSTDKKTLTQVATYFNPLRLNDRMPSQKGMHDPGPQDARSESGQAKDAVKDNKQTKSAKEPPKDKKSKKASESASESPASGSRAETGAETGEQELLRDPYGVLERIAGGEAGSSGYKVGREPRSILGLPRDAFDPKTRQSQEPRDVHPVKAAGPEKKGPEASAREPAKPLHDGVAFRSAEEKLAGEGTNEKEIDAAQIAAADADAKQRPAKELSTRELKQALGEALADIKPGAKPDIDVVDLKKEVMISLTDEFDFGMFAVGSAKPTRELIGVMDRVGKVLAKFDGAVSIRGHTDARQYRTADNDNWRLSMARAQMAFYMLLRGGLQERRVKLLEGYADRMLKVPTDPLAAGNRRIEIVIAKAPA